MATKSVNPILLFLICFFFGWFGLDKLVAGGTKEWKLALIKFLLVIVVVGIIWNIYDMICIVLGKYKLNPLN